MIRLAFVPLAALRISSAAEPKVTRNLTSHQLALRRHKPPHLANVDVAYPLFLFLSIGTHVFNNVQESESRPILQSQREGFQLDIFGGRFTSAAE